MLIDCSLDCGQFLNVTNVDIYYSFVLPGSPIPTNCPKVNFMLNYFKKVKFTSNSNSTSELIKFHWIAICYCC